MDPQQRLLLEVAWEALEDAGIAPDRLAGTPHRRVRRRHRQRLRRLRSGRRGAARSRYTCTGQPQQHRRRPRSPTSSACTGPALAVDTACSSSLVALHLAVPSLRRGECDAGAGRRRQPDADARERDDRCRKPALLAPDGRCKTFDAAADGYVRGEGCGVVVLKRLDDALADGDRVCAVIRGIARSTRTAAAAASPRPTARRRQR